MKFSIIIPVYNVEQYLEKCLLSVVEQNYHDYEIIIVIDGATDGSQEIAENIKKRYPEKNIQIICQENNGLGGARNTGMQYASGDYWLFVDSDDYLDSHALETLAKVTANDKYDMIYFNTYVVDEKGEKLQILQVQPPQKKDTTLEESPELIQTFPAAWNKLYKRSLFEDGIRYQEKKWFEDLDVALKFYLKAKRILFIDDVLYYYLQRKGSIMSDSNVQRNMEMLDIFDSILQYYQEKGALEKFRDQIEYLAVWKIMILVMSRINMAEPDSKLQDKLVDYMEKNFPNYLQNQYLKNMDAKNFMRVTIASKRNYEELYQKFARKDKLKKIMKFLIPSWAARWYYLKK